MSTETIRQKLHEYIDSASEEDLEVLYLEVKDLNGAEWTDEFAQEMEERMQEMESGRVQPVSLENALQNAKNAIQKVRNRA